MCNAYNPITVEPHTNDVCWLEHIFCFREKQEHFFILTRGVQHRFLGAVQHGERNSGVVKEEADTVKAVLLVVVLVVAVAASPHARKVDQKGPKCVGGAKAQTPATKQGLQYANVSVGAGKAERVGSEERALLAAIGDAGQSLVLGDREALQEVRDKAQQLQGRDGATLDDGLFEGVSKMDKGRGSVFQLHLPVDVTGSLSRTTKAAVTQPLQTREVQQAWS